MMVISSQGEQSNSVFVRNDFIAPLINVGIIGPKARPKKARDHNGRELTLNQHQI